MAEEPVSLQDLHHNLQQYQEQLAQVEQLLQSEPDNEEYLEIYQSLVEAIQLSEDVLRQAAGDQTVGAAAFGGPTDAGEGASQEPRKRNRWGEAPATVSLTQTLQQPLVPTMLPASVAEQIRRAQVKAAFQGQAPLSWAVGAACQAKYVDGKWYDAQVTGVSEAGSFVVEWVGYHEKTEVPVGEVRMRVDNEEGYMGVSAPKRAKVEEQPVIEEMPKWLEIKPEDNEKEKQRKKKLAKSYKSKMRFAKLDAQQKEKQNNWQSFMKGKGAKKKTGFLTNTMRESMFAVPKGDDGLKGKVGVVGSGRGMTKQRERLRNEHEPEAEDDV